MRTKLFSTAGLVVASIASPMLHVPGALAQTATRNAPAEETALESIVVTGTRQAYRADIAPLETPQADLVIDAETLEDAGVIDLNQALDLSASVARQNNFGGLWNSFAVRGFVGDENLPSNFLVNGFNAGRGFGGPRDMAGVERVEILKGPRAALFGRGEPGGTVNLVTKRPTFERSGEIRLSAGRFDIYRADADWTAPLTEQFAVRLVGYYEDAGSFRDTVDTLRYGLMPSFIWRLNDRTRLVYELEYNHQEVPFDRGVLAIDGQLGAIPRSRFLGEPGDGPLEADVLGHQVELQHDFNANWNALLGFNYRDTSLEGFSTEPELTGSRQRLFVDGRTLTRQRRFRDYDATYRVFRAELAGRFETAGLQHRIILGVDADKFENDQVFLRARAPSLASNPTLQQLQALDVFAPVYGRFPLPEPTPLTDRVETQESLGFYVQDQITLTDRLDLRVGVRFDDFDQELENRAAATTTTQSSNRFSPQVGAAFAVTESVSVYASYGENFRPLSGADFAGNTFSPNRSRSMEAGMKFELREGALSGNVSFFHAEQDNILVADPLNPGFTQAAGEAESQGLEVDLQGEVARGLRLWLSYAYVDAEVSDDVLDPDFGKVVSAGDRLLNVPRHSFNAQLVKDTVVVGRPLSLGGGVLHVGERLGEVGTGFELPDYTLVRLFAAYEVTPSVSVRADIDNLFDETYYTNSFAAMWVQPGQPRAFRVSTTFRF